jgi:hypothetical protein
MRLPLACALALVAYLAGPWAGPLRAQESLEQALLQQAPRLIKLFQEHHYQNVGVLKFLVGREGQDRLSDRAGTLNLLLARRLEVALVLANDPRQPVGILADASAVAEKTPGASHLSKDGRLKLFAASYPLAWGKEQVRPDAFVTGVAQVSGDLKTLTLSLLLVDRKENKLAPVLADFQAANRADQLAEMGESFVLRGAFDDGQTEPTSPGNKGQAAGVHEASRVEHQESPHPARRADVPVKLEVYYDGQKVPVEVKGGRAYLPEPAEGQKVQLALKHDRSRERYGVVLKVNGENTLGRQRLPDLSCRAWVLPPGEGTWWVDGFYLGRDRKLPFRVLSAPESKAREVYYGPDVGTITMTVFRETRGKEGPGDLSDEAARVKVVARLPEPKKRAENYHALVAKLLEDANSRGLIEGGQEVKTRLNTVRFRRDPRPVMCLTLVYYKR